MPPILTQVARAADALPLVATSTPTHGLIATNEQQQDAKRLMRSMTTGSPKMSIQSGDMTFYYMARDNLCFLTLCEQSYPKRLAFLYLEQVAEAITQEMIKDFGGNWRQAVDQAARPFAFIKYDPVIQRKQRDFRDTSTPQQQFKSQLSDDLSEIHSIMKKNIDEILNRGEKLEHVSNVSNELRAKSKDFKWGAKKLSWQARMQQYGPMVLISIIITGVFYFKLRGILF